MLFRKKSKREKCNFCKKEVESKFSYCPYCGKPTIDEAQLQKEFGLLGNSDEELSQNPLAATGILGQIIAPMMQGFAKSLMEQMSESQPEIQQLPNGISIRINSEAPRKRYRQVKPLKTEVSEKQLKKMSGLPRVSAKTKIKRLSDKIIYDLEAPGVEDIKDIFISKLETGYEIKAITKNKVYTNSLPVNLPLLQYSFNEKGISVEFANQ